MLAIRRHPRFTFFFSPLQGAMFNPIPGVEGTLGLGVFLCFKPPFFLAHGSAPCRRLRTVGHAPHRPYYMAVYCDCVL